MMKEITRIHLAKSSYDIELAAKKQLEKYITSLEAYAQDDDVMQDIEIRMTELLDERGVKPNGVITLDDVKAICQQLGEPHEFASEEADIALGSTKTYSAGKRILYRDGNTAVLGGVLSGLAAYTGINAIWLRIAFLVVTLVSFGTALLIYVVMWFIVPKARTAAEKLAMKGEPATLESIKRLNASEELAGPNNTARFVVRFIQIFVGVGASIGALVALAAVVGVVSYVFFGSSPFEPIMDSALFWVTLVLAGIAGLLLATLFFLIAYAAFTSKFTKHIVIAGISVIVAGILVFSAAIATGVIGSAQYSQRVQALVKEETVALPDSFKTVNSVTFEKNGESFYPTVEYIVDTGVPRYVLSSLPGEKVAVDVQGTTGSVTFSSDNTNQSLPFVGQTRLTIYGPAINELQSKNLNVQYRTPTQEKLTIIGKAVQQIHVIGTIANLDVKGEGEVDVSTSSITSLNIDNTKGGNVWAGTVRSLSVTQSDVCPDQYNDGTRVTVRGVSSGVMTYNGTQRQATSISTACARVAIGEEA